VKQESLKVLADGATTLAVGSGASSYFGWFVFINEYAPGVGVILSFVFGVVGIIFYWLNQKKLTLADENKRGLLVVAEKLDVHIEKLDTHIQDTNKQNAELKNEFKSGINSILNKLG